MDNTEETDSVAHEPTGPTDIAAGAPFPISVGSLFQVFWVALRLGLTSFGGPIAHLGYFREEYVVRRKWLDEQSYADVVALAQSLPGPASSKVGIIVGTVRAGLPGAVLAWLGFTMPSAIALIVFGYGVQQFAVADAGWLHGLKLAAVAVVAQAVWGMRSDRVAISQRIRPWMGIVALVLFFVLLLGLPSLRQVFGENQTLAVLDSFYRTGSLVFGGGHVVLPLLQSEVVAPGWVGKETFLAGYGAAQAVPGPIFTFSAYLGTVMIPEPNGVIGGLIALGAIFLPAFFLSIGPLPFWDILRRRPAFQSVLRGVNAAVVGLLLAALYDPVWTSAVKDASDFALAAAALGLLMLWKLPPWLVVILSALGGAGLAAI